MQFKVEHIFGDIHIITPTIHKDCRGQFHETFNVKSLMDTSLGDIMRPIAQINHSFSKKGVVRGMHFQDAHPQAKIVMVTKGKVIDFIQDIRKDSPTFGMTYYQLLDDLDYKILYVPRGFSHGFIALEDSDFVYLCDEVRYAEDERGYNVKPILNKYKQEWTEKIGIDIDDFIITVSERDINLPVFEY